jgi:uncharacterized protein (TIGR02246 family)
MTTKTGWGDASALLAAAGVAEDTGYYRGFTGDDERAVLSVAMTIQAAWAANDADAFAAVFAENGSLLMRDEQLTSRGQIRSFMAGLFAGSHKGARVKGWPVEVQFLSDTAAMFVTEGGVLMPGEDTVGDANLIRATWVVKKAGDKLELVSHQSSPIKS